MPTFREIQEELGKIGQEPLQRAAAPPDKKKRVRKANEWPKVGSEPVEKLLEILKIPQDWDVLIIGDGSGYPDSKNAAGYAAVVIDCLGNRELVMGTGRFNNYQAEIEAPLQALLWYHDNYGESTRSRLRSAILRTVIFSDNEAVVAVGRRGCVPNSMEQKCAPRWMTMVGLMQQGYQCSWYWMPRDICSLHSLVDHASREKRQSLNELVPGLSGMTLMDINPSEMRSGV
jgi:ribonuclease HI